MSKKVRLHRNVIRAIEHVSYDLGATHEQFLQAHKERPTLWYGKAKHLNNLPLETLERALFDGYVCSEEAEFVELSEDVIECLNFMRNKLYLSDEYILEMHANNPDNWKLGMEPLNGIDYDTLEKALDNGYVLKPLKEEVIYVSEEKVINKAVEVYNNIKGLEAELDYQLIGLHEAIKSGDTEIADKIKQRLVEIHADLGLGLNVECKSK